MELKTRHVERQLYVNYLKRAQECLQGAKLALDEKKYDLSAIDAVHCGISAADAICVYYLQCRNTGEKHADVVELIKTIKEIKHEELRAIAGTAAKIISMKNMAEYEERSIKPKEAEALYHHALKIMEMVMEKLG